MVDDNPAEGTPKLDQVNLVASDVRASIEFYRLLGFDPAALPAEWRAHHAAFELPGGMSLEIDSEAFASTWNQGQTRSGQRPVIGFAVPERAAVDQLYERLTGAGYHGAQPPYDAFWGARYAIVEDPDGNPVGLMSPSDPAWRSAPPPPPS